MHPIEVKLAEIAGARSTVEDAETALKLAKANLKNLEENELVELVDPEIMTNGVTLSDGAHYTFKYDFHCSIPARRKTEAHAWFEANGGGGLLRRYLTLSLGKESMERAREMRGWVRKAFPQLEVSVRVGTGDDSQFTGKEINDLLNKAGATGVEIDEATELPGSILRQWVSKRRALGQAVPEFIDVYAPLVAVRSPTAALPETIL